MADIRHRSPPVFVTVSAVTQSAVLTTAEGENNGAFTGLDWLLLAIPSVVFGASFLLMAIGLEAMDPGVITFGRAGFGFLALSLFPGSRRSVARSDWPRIVLLGFTWIALPLTLFPLAQQHISSAVTGMLNGGTPILVGLVATGLLRRAPGRRQLLGVLVGFLGIVLISIPTIGEGSNSALGVLMVLGAISGYGISLNVAVPLQQTYGALAVIWRVQLVGLIVSLPGFLLGLPDSRFEPGPILALITVGAVGTGLAYVAMAQLGGRVGSTRSSIVTYLATPVAMLLGLIFRSDTLTALQVAGGALTLSGAWFASRADRAKVGDLTLTGDAT